MPWVKFTADYDWFPPELARAWHQCHKAGSVAHLPRTATIDAISKNAARPATEEEIANERWRLAEATALRKAARNAG